MHRRKHVRQLVEGREIVERRRPADVFQIAKIGGAGHRNEDRLAATKRNALFRVAGMKGDFGRDRCDQRFDQRTVQMDTLAADIGTGAAPVLKCDIVPENDTDFLQNIQRGAVDPLDLLFVQRFGQWQAAGQARQHGVVGTGPQVAAFAAPASAAQVLL